MSVPMAIVVAGDVCIDWLSIPLDPVSIGQGPRPPENWQLVGGQRMYSRPGGAWLTAKFTRDAAADEFPVAGPEQLPQKVLDSLSPEEMIHSLLKLDRYRRSSTGKDFVVAVATFDGFAGPADANSTLRRVKLEPSASDDASVVVLDDAGNGFRDGGPGWGANEQPLWPRAIQKGKAPSVVFKLRRPLKGGALGSHLKLHHADRTVALLDVEELRAEADGMISRSLSWERTATDVVVALHRSPGLRHLLSFAHLIIPLGLEGVLHVEGGEIGSHVATLWYCPDRIEGDLSSEWRGGMTGYASALAAAVSVQLAKTPESARFDTKTLGAGIRMGLKAAWRLFEKGFGPCKKDSKVPEPNYPGAEIFDPAEPKDFRICSVELNAYPRRMTSESLTSVDAAKREEEISRRFDRDLAEFRAWRVLDSKKQAPYSQIAEQIVRQGIDHVLPEVPIARFGALELIDRREIECYRTIRNLIREFLKNRKPERPLCLAVFGAPGAGKSFGVVQVAKALSRANPDAGEVEKFEFNVSQWQSPEDLANALHHVRDSALRGNVPLVFFDEFDCAVATGELAWLKFFLAPMQDGVFNDGAFTHVIGRAIFVFAGGTSSSYAQFQKKALSGGERMTAVKAPDFLSRLRGYVDVQSIGQPVGAQLVRRALLLRSFLIRKCKQFIDPKTGNARVSSSVLQAFLNVSGYQHGVRSIEAILDMSRLDGYSEFSASLLPPVEQLELHVSSADFQALVNLSLDLGDNLDILARAAHESFVASQAGKRDPNHPTMQRWEQLSPLYKNSNREQVAHLPIKLAAVGCGFRRVAHGQVPASFAFMDEEMEKMAMLEHERWMEERRWTEPNHPCMVPWEQLSEAEKKKDRDSIRMLPGQLQAVGLEICRLE